MPIPASLTNVKDFLGSSEIFPLTFGTGKQINKSSRKAK